MNVPTEIRKKAKACASHFEKANMLDDEIRNWMEENNLSNDTNMDQFIDSVELTNNPDSFISFIESEDLEIGNQEL